MINEAYQANVLLERSIVHTCSQQFPLPLQFAGDGSRGMVMSKDVVILTSQTLGLYIEFKQKIAEEREILVHEYRKEILNVQDHCCCKMMQMFVDGFNSELKSLKQEGTELKN